MTPAPAITVLMSVFKADRHLPLAVESVLSQDFQDFELLVMDDGSADDMGALFARHANERISLHRNEANLGLTRSLNRGLALARGRYIARMDADDICLPGRLRLQFEYMQLHPEVGLLGGQANCINEAGGLVFQERHPTAEHLLRWLLIFLNPFWHPSVMLRTAVLRAAGGYDESIPYAQDYELWARLAKRTRLAQLEEPVLLYRIHAKSVTCSRGAEQEACALRVSRESLGALGLDGVSDDLIRGAREVLIQLPVVHANPDTLELLRRSQELFARRNALTDGQLADLLCYLHQARDSLVARHPAATSW